MADVRLSPRPLGRAFWRDDRFIQAAVQVIVVAVVAGLLYLAFRNMADALARQGITLGFGFLESAAGFDLGESLIPYSNTDTFARALLAGLLNITSVRIYKRSRGALRSRLVLLTNKPPTEPQWIVYSSCSAMSMTFAKPSCSTGTSSYFQPVARALAYAPARL